MKLILQVTQDVDLWDVLFMAELNNRIIWNVWLVFFPYSYQICVLFQINMVKSRSKYCLTDRRVRGLYHYAPRRVGSSKPPIHGVYKASVKLQTVMVQHAPCKIRGPRCCLICFSGALQRCTKHCKLQRSSGRLVVVRNAGWSAEGPYGIEDRLFACWHRYLLHFEVTLGIIVTRFARRYGFAVDALQLSNVCENFKIVFLLSKNMKTGAVRLLY